MVVQTIEVGEEGGTDTTTTTAAPATDAGSGSGTTAPSAVPVPSGVPSGTSGLAADGGSTFPVGAAAALLALALVGLVVAGRGIALDRRRS